MFRFALSSHPAIFRNHCRSLAVLFFAVLALSATPAMLAQVSTADILGTIQDSSNAVVPNASVTARNLATGLEYKTTSNSDGEVAITQLPAGSYSLTVEMPGFVTWRLGSVTLAGGDRYRISTQLTVGATSQVVNVTADPAALQTDTSAVSAAINQEQTENLPVNGRNMIELAQYTPGATDYKGGGFSGTPDDERRDSTISVNGRTGAENNFLIDGQDNNERFVNTVLVKPSEDGTEELRVISNSPSAELSRASGATIVFVTKGGTNRIHGSAFEFLRNEALDAFLPNTIPGARKPVRRQNNFGGSVGGPIIKNKFFYFGDYEVYKSTQGTVLVSTVPNAAMRLGNFAGVADVFDPTTTVTTNGVSTRQQFTNDQIPTSSMDPVALKMVNLFPLPNVPGAGLVNNYSLTSAQTQNDQTADTRFDYKISAANSLFVRYNYDHNDTTLPSYLPPSGGYQIGGITPTCFPYCYGLSGSAKQRIHSAGAIDTITLSSSSVLILRMGYGRYQNQALPVGFGTTPATSLGIQNLNTDLYSSGFPDISLTNFTGLGAGNFYPTLNTNNAFSYGGSWQILKGNHLIKMGGEFVRRQVEDFQSQEPKAGYAFTPAFSGDPQNFNNTGNAIASFLLGYPASTLRARFLILPGYRTLENGWFIQDDYRITTHLTLNLGLRYDYFSPLSEVRNRLTNFDYAAASVLFAGQNGIGNTAGVQKDYSDVGPRFGFAWQATQKWNVFGAFGMMYTPGMLGTPGAMRNAPYTSQLNIAPNLITVANRISDPLPALVPDSVTNPVGTFWSVARNYRLPYVEQFNINIQRQLPFGVVFTTGYVSSLGKRQSGSNDAVPLNGTTPGAAADQQRRPLYSKYPLLGDVQTVRNYYVSSYGSLQTSLQKRFSNGMTFNINHTWAHSIDNSEVRYYVPNNFATLNGSTLSDIRHRLAAIWVFQIPGGKMQNHFVSAVTHNWELNAIGTWETGLPFSVTQTSTQTNGATGQNRPNVIGNFHVANASAAEWFNPAAFQAQPIYTWGNEGPNLLVAPGTWDMDLGLHRNFQLHRGLSLQLRAEAFDFTNTRHPNAPISSLGAPGFGSISTYNSSRTMQIAAKILF